MRDYLFFYLNGEAIEVRGGAAFQTLAGFLRSERHATGTKIVCDEGDCGACTVLIGRPDEDRLVYRPVNACIQHVYQVDGTHVVTVEGVVGRAGNGTSGDGAGGLSPIQQSMIVHHGAQCGFCTPGFVTAMTALFEEDGPVTAQTVRDGLTGNLCRCTGYDPITQAALAVDPTRVRRLNGLYDPSELLTAFARHTGVSVQIQSDGQAFASPTDIESAVRFLGEHDDALIVQGGTDVGVWCNKRDFRPKAVLSLRQIPDLDRIEVRGGRLEVGAGATLAALEPIACKHAPALYEILRLFGSPQIRYAGTLAGNIANASPIADTLPFLFVMEADVELAGPRGRRSVGIRDLYKGYKDLDIAPDELIVNVSIPLPEEHEVLRLYKVSKRKDLDISSFTAAVRMTFDGDRIGDIRLAYGGVGPVVLRLPRTEAWLSGRPFALDAFVQAGRFARREITPISDVRGSRDFRLTLAETILQKFYRECQDLQAQIS